MWQFTKFGFFSTVLKGDKYHVRARRPEHLHALVGGLHSDKAYAELPLVEEWPLADYRWRIIVDAATFSDIQELLAEAVDYANFKSELAAVPELRDLERIAHQVWHILHRDQEAYERRQRGGRPLDLFGETFQTLEADRRYFDDDDDDQEPDADDDDFWATRGWLADEVSADVAARQLDQAEREDEGGADLWDAR